MTDDEINKRVAEIEGLEFNGHYWFRQGEQPEYFDPPPYATDWAWVGQLVEKYAIDLLTDGKAEWRAVSVRHPVTDKMRDVWGAYEKTPHRAICLAVIAAHEGK